MFAPSFKLQVMKRQRLFVKGAARGSPSVGQWRVNVTVQIQDCEPVSIGCSCPLAPLLAACYSTFPIPTVSTKEELCTCSANTFQHGCVKIRRESNNQKSWSSAAHMGNVQAWKWVTCVYLCLHLLNTTVIQCWWSRNALITLPSWSYLNIFNLTFYWINK